MQPLAEMLRSSQPIPERPPLQLMTFRNSSRLYHRVVQSFWAENGVGKTKRPKSRHLADDLKASKARKIELLRDFTD